MEIVLGGPGCGKTTALISRVMQLLAQGVSPEEIAYVAFTRKAAEEATERAQAELGLDKDSMPFFRTLHSLAFKLGGYAPTQIMMYKHWKEYAEWMNIIIHGQDSVTGIVHTETRELECYALSRLKCLPLEQVCYEEKVDFKRADYYARHLKKYKDARNVVDYTDLLENFLDIQLLPYLHTLIVDEAQDLCRLQWKMVDKLREVADNVIVAGDDDQAIYEWAGADTAHFLNLEGSRTVLPKSYRMDEKIWSVVKGISGMITNRFEKNFTFNKEGGEVTRVSTMTELDFSTEASWLILCRSNYQLEGPRNFLRNHGLPYIQNNVSSVDTEFCRSLLAWEALRKGKSISAEDAYTLLQHIDSSLCGIDTRLVRLDPTLVYTIEDFAREVELKDTPDWMTAIVMPESEKNYYREIKRSGHSLIDRPRITLATIHAVKGGEADNVALFPDLSTKAYEAYIKNPEQEARVFYVGASRAREKLFIFAPQTYSNFKIPEAA